MRNRGNSRSDSMTLRYYRSPDSTTSTSDTLVEDASVGSLPASGSSRMSVNLKALSNSGTYYYGACVDAVSGEYDAGNNCSGLLAVTVSSPVVSATVPRHAFLPIWRQLVLPVHLVFLAPLLGCISAVAGDVEFQDD